MRLRQWGNAGLALLLLTGSVPLAAQGADNVPCDDGCTTAGSTAASGAAAKPPASPWKGVFYDNDFSAFVDKDPYVVGEELKDIPLDFAGDELDFQFSTGGQLRHRYMSESDRFRPGGPETSDYNLWRWRHYFDLKNEYVRFYVETIHADCFGEDLPLTPIDVNRFDLLNAFVDLTLYKNDDLGTGTFRYGRQELLYGKQRLLSPLDWGNTRRNFNGAKFMHAGEGWKFDAFVVNPVNAAARGVDFVEYDSKPDEADHRRILYGGYLSLTGEPMLSADLFMLYQDDERPRPDFAEGDRGLNGLRLYGTLPVAGGDRAWDYDLEGGYQWGSDLGRRVTAGFVTGELGHTWSDASWKPRLSGVVYYGSGGGRDSETFYTYYPLGHAYWGILDNLAGQNLIDLSPQVSISPLKKLNLTGAYHYFRKADDEGFLYNVAQVPVGPTNIGNDIGQEVDMVATWTFNPNLNIQAGYAHMWYGEVGETITDRDASHFYYVQTTLQY